MITFFKNSNEFIEYRTHCVFCKTKLKPILSNYTVVASNGFYYLPSVKSNFNNNSFDFKLKFITSTIHVQSDVSLDCNNNFVNFSNIEPPQDSKNAIEAFDFLRLNIELRCNQKSCKLKYYVSSDVLELENIKGVTARLKSPKLHLESFKLGKLMIHNDFQNAKTNIYSINRSDADPIQVPIIDFTSFEKEKLFTRIKTYVTFS